jgi:ATP-dependent RNA helicase SUPV3L1/SUV3
VLDPLVPLRHAAESPTLPGGGTLPGPARGLAFQLAEALGSLSRKSPALPADLRTAAQALRPFGVRVGFHSVFLPRLIKPQPSALAALLWAIHSKIERIPPPPQPGLTSFALDKDDELDMPEPFLAAAFYRKLGPRAVRLDILERLESVLVDAAKSKKNADAVLNILVSLMGCSQTDSLAVTDHLGWRRQSHQHENGELVQVWRRAKRPSASRHRQRGRPTKADSPFARLARLIPAD